MEKDERISMDTISATIHGDRKSCRKEDLIPGTT